jgi:hypothetical protein
MSTLEVGKIVPATGTAITLGDSGDTFTLPASATLTIAGTINASSGTATGFGDNTPAWHVGINSSTQSITDVTTTKVELDDVKFDTGFTWDTTNYKGIPGTAGKYLIGCFASLDAVTTSLINAYVYLYKNGASQAFWGWHGSGNNFNNGGLGGITILDLGATDYVEMFVYFDYNSSSATIRQHDATQCVTYMFGTKLIGA